MIIRNVIVIIFIVIFKAVLTSIETSLNVLYSKKSNQINNEANINDFIYELMKNFERYIATINVLNIITVVFLGTIISGRITNLLLELLSDEIKIEPYTLRPIIIFIITIITTYFMVFLGSIIPRKMARRNPRKTIMFFKFPLKLFYILLYPFVQVLHISVHLFAILFGGSNSLEYDSITQEEILMMLDVGEETGTIDESEKEMINNIFEFDNKNAGDISTHRKDIVAISADSSLEAIINIVMEEKYSRIPVYEGNIDNIIGILHIKDIMKYMICYKLKDFELKNLLRPPYFVPFTKKTDELFEEMQKNKIQMSIIIDEYGGTAGIVTMEDLIEEIMGNILDEYDDEEKPEISVINENTYILDGTADLGVVSEKLNIEFPSDEYDTIGGFIIGQLGHIPKDTERCEIEFENFLFSIEKIEDKRIVSIRVTKIS